MKKIVVVGGGAAGLMAAITAADQGADVTLVEQNEKIGKKLYITGKGRCNVTNACPASDFFSNVSTNEKFLYSAIRSFDSFALCDFLEEAGLPLKTERGNRVFPVSDKSSDVIKTLQKECGRAGVKILLYTKAEHIRQQSFAGAENPDSGLAAQVIKAGSSERTEQKPGKNALTLQADAVIIATGGISYRSTGATGDGYVFAQHFGHQLVEPIPSLVPLRLKDAYTAELEGLSLRNVAIKVAKTAEEKPVFEDFGELVFTAGGVSGPVILTASSRIGRQLADADSSFRQIKTEKSDGYRLFIDLKPALTETQLDQRILRDFEENKNREFKNSLQKLLPAKLIPVMIRLSGIAPEKRVNEITRGERMQLMRCIKQMPFTIAGLEDFSHAVITKGGVEVKKISPKTMESKLVPGLFFAGEVLDVDALTGGFNLQIAFATGHAAGLAAAGKAAGEEEITHHRFLISCTKQETKANGTKKGSGDKTK